MTAWDAFVAGHRLGTVYHTSLWRDVIQSAYGPEPVYFGLVDAKGAIIAGIPAFLIRSRMTGARLSTLPCAQCCDPLVGDEDEYQALKRAVLKYMAENKVRGWELKTAESFPYERSAVDVAGRAFVTYTLSTDRPVEEIFRSLHKSCIQRAVRKAQRAGFVVERCLSPEGIPVFYRLYLQMRLREGFLPQPQRFFEALWRVMAKSGAIEILFARHREGVVSAVMLLKFKDAVMYEYGATAEDVRHLSPSSLLLWSAVESAAHAGYRTFDFGRTAVDDASLALFKSRWGTRREYLRYYQVAETNPAAMLRSSGLTTRLMRLAVRALPERACVLGGRMLYHHLI